MRQSIFDSISVERDRQDEKHGDSNALLSPFALDYIAFIAEELGEASQILQYILSDVNRRDDVTLTDHYISELTQVAALCVQVIEKIRGKSD